ncbi:dolichol phosphate-mannose biosynthesis regulatory protein isoform X1 [Petromyzon marinus]|uniref:dolichol phosphate-mannose biosynthesis regulatory protein isoform X1 n=1 Tax=Petromyzon marinus TaxID=7757 RepID=UPI003F6EF568
MGDGPLLAFMTLNVCFTRATGLDQLVGMGLVGVSAVVFIYYSVWVLVLPFVDELHPLQSLFLPRDLALLLPAAALLLVSAGLGLFMMAVRWKNHRSKKSA